MLADVEAWVADQLRRGREPGPDGLEDITEAAPHPDGVLVACTVLTRSATDADPVRAVALVDLGTGEHRVLDLPFEAVGGAQWDRSGRWLAVVATGPAGSHAAVLGPLDGDALPVGGLGADLVVVESQVEGTVESCHWSPDGTRLALLTAAAGAEISDVHGSGRVPGGGTWRPRVLPADGGRRRAVVWHPHGADPDEAHHEVPHGDNVWELCWADEHSLLALTSAGAGEGDWYDATLRLLDAETGAARTLLTPEDQLAGPRVSPDGARWSVLSGLASDRGLLAGRIVLGATRAQGDVPPDVDGRVATPEVATPEVDTGEVDTGGVDVTDHGWLDDHHVLWAGLRGLETVVGVGDVVTGRSREVWSGPGTTGAHQPVVSGVAGADPVVVLERHDSPPALGRLGKDGWHPVLRTDGPGTRFVTAQGGSTSPVSWVSRDGTQVQGLLSLPDADGPHALVVDVHGGPVTAWHDGWLGRDTHARLLVARGYAVLRPNPRGSTGRGPAYASAVVGDVGGRDVTDVLAGVEHLVGAGSVDPARVGVTGTSYGGYLAAWMPCRSDVFAASVACSPVTDWVSQHLTTNVAELDLRMLEGDPFDGASHYTTRSPLAHVHRISTPMLLTAGLQDLACPPAQAQVLYGALRARGVEAALAVYPEEGHGVRGAEALTDQCARLVAWFERFMPPGRA